MKNKKGQVATLLTLGLVLVGGLVTLGISLLTNNNKIAMSSRAAFSCPSPNVQISRTSSQTCSNQCLGIGYNYLSQDMPTLQCCCKPAYNSVTPTPTPKPGGGACPYVKASCPDACSPDGAQASINYCTSCSDGTYKCKTDPNVTLTPTPKPTIPATCTLTQACCFVQNGKVHIYASSTARTNNGMCTPCDKAHYGSAYNATDWFECPDNTPEGESISDYNNTNNPPPPKDLNGKCQDGYTSDECKSAKGTWTQSTVYGDEDIGTCCPTQGSNSNACEANNSKNDGYVYSCKSASSICPSMSSTSDSCGDSSLQCCKDKGTSQGGATCSQTATVCATGDKTKKYYTSADNKNIYTDSKCSNLIGSLSTTNITNYCAETGGNSTCSATATTCTVGIGTDRKKYYMSQDNKKFYTDAACSNLIDTFTQSNMTNYCYGAGGEGVPQNINPGSNTCVASRQLITVNGNSVGVEKPNDIGNNVACDHVLVASTANAIQVFRECPSFLQGSSCVYACFQNGTQHNCEGTFQNPQYDQAITSIQAEVTVFNTSTTDPLDVQVNVRSNSPTIVISQTTIPVSHYVGGTVSCASSYANLDLTIKHKKQSDSDFALQYVTAKCGSQTLINLDN